MRGIFHFRDSLLATLLDAVRGSGNMDVHVQMKATARGKRMGPFYVPMEEEVLLVWKENMFKTVTDHSHTDETKYND